MSQIKLVLAIALGLVFFGSWATLARAEDPPGTVSKIGFSQGVSAYWEEVRPNGEKVFTNFSLSGGWDYTHQTWSYPSAPTTSWMMKEFWYSFTKIICPSTGGSCATVTQSYGLASSASFSFYNNREVSFSDKGYHFTFVADRLLKEGVLEEARHNQEPNGSFCWYSHQNMMRRGQAIIMLPDGTTLSGVPGGNGSTYTDWNAEYGEGRPYVPSCIPYWGGGKG